ncbi:hypothetical protein BDR06DRAFT_959025 [Suillus hirtellus]|nr:hypothetical protein BDR06DRAFT_959025 [Suillus hirtellus]
MTVVLNDPSLWPLISGNVIFSYFIIAACGVVIYDWGLTFGQEVELVWKQRWSLMTILYLVARYVAIGYAVISTSISLPTIWQTDASCLILYDALNWMGDILQVILGVIIITRLHAMYQRSRKVLIFLVVVFLATRIAIEIMVAMTTKRISGEEIVLSGTYLCNIDYAGDTPFLSFMTWILGTVWEVLALCLAVWIAVKHFRGLRQHSTRGIMEDCFTVLMRTHLSYFASYLAISCFHIGLLSPTLSGEMYSIYIGFTQVFEMAQLSVLGPRLILSVREYHAKLVADSDAATAMTSIAFQEHVDVEASSSV